MKIGIVILLLFWPTRSILAQDPCDDANTIGLLRTGRSYTARCDSLYILSKQKYYLLQGELKYYKDMAAHYAELTGELERVTNYMDSLRMVQDKFIARQDTAIVKYRSLLEQSNTLVDRSTANTDRALDELKKARLRMWIMSGLSMIAGGVLGLIVSK
ncbi:hypothetical protein K1X84_09350 [bacterium]|nr:hypothetical protein [bacterium]